MSYLLLPIQMKEEVSEKQTNHIFLLISYNLYTSIISGLSNFIVIIYLLAYLVLIIIISISWYAQGSKIQNTIAVQ